MQNVVWEKTEIQRRRKTRIKRRGKEYERKEEKNRISHIRI